MTFLERSELPLLRARSRTAPIFADLHRDHGVDLRSQARYELTGRNGAVTAVILSDGSRIDADMVSSESESPPTPSSPQRPASTSTTGSSSMSTSAAPIRTSSPPATSPTPTTRAWAGTFVSSTGPTPDAKACHAGKAMLGQDAVDARPSYFFTDQYDLSMEYTGDIGPSGYDQVIFRRYPDPRQLIVFWLQKQRVQAGMNINIWDVADDIERLVQSPHPAVTDDLADPGIPLDSVL